ncbi:XRE family transcriptional regulator [Xenorhabdus sp. PB62.4]|uniref:XRE family transcriptional regulator n=1 Tax=Xenorhabdus sp. PB62.4 TaxID=1851573 RepID=UPI0016574481|nr:XRE family transcriptional regulator [Xenorhabdus sp. PB62.4]MBC8953359.1 hypothetical protein [Xenorhabdus sp. PB62.4]
MTSEAFVELALRVLSCTQKQLSSKLDVSPTQITKWKKGEHMSLDMEKKFRDITKIGELDPKFVLWAGSYENALGWQKIISQLADISHENEETGYTTALLQDDMLFLCSDVCSILTDMGVKPPESFPKELSYEDEDDEKIWKLIEEEENNYINVIYEIFNALNNVYGFYAAYVADLIYDEELNLFETEAINIEPALISLAACKIDIDIRFAPKQKEFRYKIIKNYEEWLNIVKNKAFQSGVPLRAELLSLIHDSDAKLGHAAEAESLGVNSSRIHPDIYMNELLVGMRVIHQVLPAILEKLDIDFKLDMTKIR